MEMDFIKELNMEYRIVALDENEPEWRGQEIETATAETKAKAIVEGKAMITDETLIESGMTKVEVRDENDEVEWDAFV